MHILVTRPEPDAEALAVRLRQAGHRVTCCPMMTIRFDAVDCPDLGGFQAVLLTSANGVRALASLTGNRDTPILAVGDATARAARDAGFATVDAAGGDVAALTALAARRLKPNAGPVLHVAGAVVAGDLKAALEVRGFTVHRLVAYRAEASTVLPDPVRELMATGDLDCALFYSPRTARIFTGLVTEAGLDWSLASVIAGCLSGAVRDALQSLRWQRIVVADRPEEPALMAALRIDCSTGL